MAIKTGSENSAITRPTTVAVRFFREIELSIVGPERLKYTGGPVRSPRELVHDTALAVRLVVVNRSRTCQRLATLNPSYRRDVSAKSDPFLPLASVGFAAPTSTGDSFRYPASHSICRAKHLCSSSDKGVFHFGDVTSLVSAACSCCLVGTAY